MAHVYLTSAWDGRADAGEAERFPVRHLRACAKQDTRRRHKVVEDPARADLIIFAEGHDDTAVGPYFEEVRASAVYRRFQSKCFLHSGIDRVIPFLPGVYPSIERRWSWPGWTRGGCFLIPKHPFLEGAAATPRPKVHLASFVGACGLIPARHRLLVLQGRRGFVVRDTGDEFVNAHRRDDQQTVARLKREYIETSAASKFVLCPRGEGASSIRLFEAMELGVVPVIISDGWVAPVGPRWTEIAVRVRERDVPFLPEILAAREADHERMARLARQAWEEHYAPQTLFDTIVEDCVAIQRARRLPFTGLRLAARIQLARPFHLRRQLSKLTIARRVRDLVRR
jgi:hypothetical protein